MDDTPGPEPIFQIASGFMSARVLMAANELDLFAALVDAPASAEELAERTDLPLRSTRILANALVAIGFLTLSGDRYVNSPVADTWLAGRSPADLRPMLRFMDRITSPQWHHLVEAARGGAAPEVAALPSEFQQIYSQGMRAITAGSARALSDVYDFAQHRRLLDIGGGLGSFLAVILGQHPELEATLKANPSPSAAHGKGSSQALTP